MTMNWKIKGRKGSCTLCERVFDEGERYVSLLSLTEDGMQRADHCVHWWERREQGHATQECAAACSERTEDSVAEEADRHLYWWYSKHEGDKKTTLKLDLDSLENLFVQLGDRKERQVRELHYLLCLLLMRKKRLKLHRVERDADGESLCVLRKEDQFEVKVFDFGQERVAELGGELQALFDGAEAQTSPADEADEGEAEPESDGQTACAEAADS